MAFKLDVRNIIRDHLKTIVNDNTGKPDFRDWFFFVIVPIVITATLLIKGVFMKDDLIDSIISGLSIYVGLALNLIVLLFEIIQKDTTSKYKREFAKDLIANICFSIILSITTIISSLFTLIDCKDEGLCWVKYVTSGLTFLLISEMIVTIIMLVRNMYFQMIEQIHSK